MMRRKLMSLMLLGVAITAVAQEKDPVLVSNETTAVYLSEYQLDLQRLPEGMRGGFANNRKRIDQLLMALLQTKTLAVMAEESGLDQKPENKKKLERERQKELAKMTIDEMDLAAVDSFEQSKEKFLTRAQERYRINIKQFEVPEQVKASHILISLKERSEEEGKALAEKIYARVSSGEDFSKLAEEFSEDPSVPTNHGELGWFDKNTMVEGFSETAFSMKKEGEISRPVKSSFGWHIIRFEGRQPARVKSFEEVKGVLMEELLKQYVAEQRAALLAKITDAASVKLNEEAINESVYIKPNFGKNLQEMLNKKVGDGVAPRETKTTGE